MEKEVAPWQGQLPPGPPDPNPFRFLKYPKQQEELDWHWPGGSSGLGWVWGGVRLPVLPHTLCTSPLPSHKWPTHLPKNLPTRGPAQALCQAVEEPEDGEDGHGGAPREGNVDEAHKEQARGEEPAGAHLI